MVVAEVRRNKRKRPRQHRFSMLSFREKRRKIGALESYVCEGSGKKGTESFTKFGKAKNCCRKRTIVLTDTSFSISSWFSRQGTTTILVSERTKRSHTHLKNNHDSGILEGLQLEKVEVFFCLGQLGFVLCLAILVFCCCCHRGCFRCATCCAVASTVWQKLKRRRGNGISRGSKHRSWEHAQRMTQVHTMLLTRANTLRTFGPRHAYLLRDKRIRTVKAPRVMNQRIVWNGPTGSGKESRNGERAARF